MTEFALISWLRERLLTQPALGNGLTAGPGDDCALVSMPVGPVLYAADMLLENVHFKLGEANPKLISRKALAVNVSDIAAMAGRPVAATVSLALPRAGGLALGQAIMDGFIEAGGLFGVAIAGGDTNSWSGPLVVSVSIVGTAHSKGSVLRKGAIPGDFICVTGALGGSLNTGRHLRFEPRVREAEHLHERYGLNAMIDLSDGLASDLRHILNESGVGACLTRAAIPIHDEVPNGDSQDRLRCALTDGEDFELCFAVSPAAGARVLAEQPFAPQLLVTKIGTVVAGAAVTFEDGSPVPVGGWEHPFN